MAAFYNVPVVWLDGTQTRGRGVGNNAAWLCKCGEVLLAPLYTRLTHALALLAVLAAVDVSGSFVARVRSSLIESRKKWPNSTNRA